LQRVSAAPADRGRHRSDSPSHRAWSAHRAKQVRSWASVKQRA